MKPELEKLVTRARTLFDDLDLEAVRSWKNAMPDRKAIGHLPVWAPRELIWAAGMLPVSVLGGGDRLEIIRGDAYFQSYICHFPRSTVELALSGRLDALDGMLFPSICDVIRNLSGMWQMLFPDLYVRYLDLPQNFDLEVGGRFWRHELEALMRDLEALAGRPISEDDLRLSIAAFAANRHAVHRLYQARSREPWLFPADEMYIVLRAGCVLPPDEHTELVERYLELAPGEAERQRQDRSRIVVAGMFCEQPPLGLLLTLERAGCFIVDDDLFLALRWPEIEVEITDPPLDGLIEAFLRQGALSASVYQPDGKRGAWLVESVERNHAEGVIFCAPSFCDPALLEQPMLVAALDESSVPHTQFKYSEDTGQFAAIREQAGTFADSIRLWGEA
ncbi:MAG: benzoyl-CoA reductase subunit C [Acidobacteriota bacterium]|nr:benzoyl-CoA reductase subunit C [Acidobacteriota bacterium]